mmetsp:Transcript_71008/g.179148  ORF Transcript_71008/g.179148 Transcript_71008/m.179148 type:complete len:295 (-) Transcript_71008:119-1003(-)
MTMGVNSGSSTILRSKPAAFSTVSAALVRSSAPSSGTAPAFARAVKLLSSAAKLCANATPKRWSSSLLVAKIRIRGPSAPAFGMANLCSHSKDTASKARKAVDRTWVWSLARMMTKGSMAPKRTTSFRQTGLSRTRFKTASVALHRCFRLWSDISSTSGGRPPASKIACWKRRPPRAKFLRTVVQLNLISELPLTKLSTAMPTPPASRIATRFSWLATVTSSRTVQMASCAIKTPPVNTLTKEARLAVRAMRVRFSGCFTKRGINCAAKSCAVTVLDDKISTSGKKPPAPTMMR